MARLKIVTPAGEYSLFLDDDGKLLKAANTLSQAFAAGGGSWLQVGDDVIWVSAAAGVEITFDSAESRRSFLRIPEDNVA